MSLYDLQRSAVSTIRNTQRRQRQPPP